MPSNNIYFVSLLVILLSSPLLINSHSTYATSGSYCDNQIIAIGEIIMGETAIADDLARYVIATRSNGNIVLSGSTYVPGEKLKITSSFFSVEILMQATGNTYQYQPFSV